MPLLSVPAVYDGKEIRLLERAPVKEPYRVLVTFVEPTKPARTLRDSSRFMASFGAWVDDRSVEETLRDIHVARQSKAEPPTL